MSAKTLMCRNSTLRSFPNQSLPIATMIGRTSEMSEKMSEKSEMSELAFASNAMRTRIAPPGTAGSKAERILAAARALRWKPSRTRDVWYADPRVSLKPGELRRIEHVSGITYGREELRSVDHLIARADALIVGAGADRGGPLRAALLTLLGALDSPGAGGRDEGSPR